MLVMDESRDGLSHCKGQDVAPRFAEYILAVGRKQAISAGDVAVDGPCKGCSEQFAAKCAWCISLDSYQFRLPLSSICT